MHKPDWQQVILDDGMLREADRERLVVWLLEKQEGPYRTWQRISSVPGETAAGAGLCWTPATLLRVRHKAAGFLGKLLGRWQKPASESAWLLPNGITGEQAMSTTTSRSVVMPILACGCCVHQCSICLASVVASRKPCCVSGALPPGTQGNTR